MTTQHNPATMIAASSTQAPTIGTAPAFIGVFVALAAVAIVWAVRTRLETLALREEQSALADTLAANEAKRKQDRVKASAVLAAAEDRISTNVATSAPIAAAVIAKARGIEGMTVHYVDTTFAPTAPAPFRG